MRNYIFWILVSLLVVAAFLPIIHTKPLRHEYILTWQRYLSRIVEPRYVFVGDSLTANGAWGWRVSGNPLAAINLAQGGATVSQISSQVVRASYYNARFVLITAGTNDVLFGQRSNEQIKGDIEQLFSLLSPLTKNIVTLIPYTNNQDINKRIYEINKFIFKTAIENSMGVVDINPDIAPGGVLMSEFTDDGVHLNDAGYDIWVKHIQRAVER